MKNKKKKVFYQKNKVKTLEEESNQDRQIKSQILKI